MNLDGLKTLEIVLGEAKTTTDCDITASYADSYVTDFILGENDLVSNGTTAVTVVSAPPFNYQRQVKEIRLHNNDTVQHQVTLRLNNGGTFRIMETASVAPGGDFLYTPDAPAVVSTGAPAILLESGATGAKISALSAATTLTGPEQFPVVQGGATDRATAYQMASLILHGAFAANPLNAAGGSGLAGTSLNLNGGTGDGVGNGGDLTILTGLSGASGTATGGFYAASVSATAGNQSTGTAGIESGTPFGNGSSGACFFGSSDAPGNGNSGTNNHYTGASAGGSSGTIGSGTGNAQVNSGSITWTTGSAATGVSGDITLITGAGPTAAASGTVKLLGTRAANDAPAGYFGEYLETNTTGTSLVTGTAKDVATRSLTAGDWDVWGSIVFHPAAGTTTSRIAGSIGTTADTLGTAPNSGAMFDESVTLAASTDECRPVGTRRLSLSGTTTVHLVALAAFAVSTMTADGFIGARRRR